MTRWPAICSGDMVAISFAWMLRSASWTLVGVAAGPCTAVAARAAALGGGVGLGLGEGEAEGVTAGRGDDACAGGWAEPQPAPSPSATMASPASTERRARWRRRRPESPAAVLPRCNQLPPNQVNSDSMVVDSHSIRTCHCLVTHARVVVDSRRR